MSALQGPLRFATVPQWFRQADTLSASETLDLAEVTYCDSAGLALLIELQRRARAQQRQLRYINAPQQLRDFAGFFGLQPVLGLDA